MRESEKRFIRWLTDTRLLAFPREILRRIVYNIIISKDGELVFPDDPDKTKIIEICKAIKKERFLGLSNVEACQLILALKATAKVNGDIGEVGVWQGASAKLICEFKGEKALFLFDTFEGLPELSDMDEPNQFHKGQYREEIENVRSYLQKYHDVNIFKGLFPSSAEQIKEKRFSFVNLDVDLYASTLSCLDFFYPRMNKGGIIITHDYKFVKGVTRAFDGFFAAKLEPVIKLLGSHCMIVKC